MVPIEGRPMSRGNRRPKADVERDAKKIAELVRAGKSVREAGAELGIAESTARRLAKRGLALLPKSSSDESSAHHATAGCETRQSRDASWFPASSGTQMNTVAEPSPECGERPAPVETFRQKQNRLQMEENSGRLTLRPGAAARRRHVEQFGFAEDFG
jgi:hypothetical protein